MSKGNETLRRIESELQKREAVWDKTAFSILLWGTGDDKELKKKRETIEKELKACGYNVMTGEEVAEKAQSRLSLPDQEYTHWKCFDLVIVLEGGIAPAMEISSYVFEPQFCKKCLVFYPAEYGPSRDRRTFPASVLGLFPHRVPYRKEEIELCTLAEECIHYAYAWARVNIMESVRGKEFLGM